MPLNNEIFFFSKGDPNLEQIPSTCISAPVQFQLAANISSRSQVLSSWVAVKELELSYYIGETLLFTIYTHYGNLI